MAIFTKNIPKHTDQSVYHNKKTLKTRRKQALRSVCLLQIFYIYSGTPPKKIYILATQSTLHNIYNKKTRLIGRVIQKTTQRYITSSLLNHH